MSFLILILGSLVVIGVSPDADDFGRSRCFGSPKSSGCLITALFFEGSPIFLITIFGDLVSSGLTSFILILGAVLGAAVVVF